MKDMRTNKKRIALMMVTFLILTSVPGCKKSYLDIDPKGKLIARNVSDYDLLFNNLNLVNVGVLANTTPNAPVVMGDEVLVLDPYYNGAALRTQRLFRWDKDIYDPDQDANDMAGLMTQLYTYNKIANEVMNADNGTEQQKNALYAEAAANRAWCYFWLANLYGKPYNAVTAATDLAYPIITQADVTQTNYTRATVQQNYDFMISDLTKAIPLLPVNSSTRVRMTKSAAEGLLGEVYVFMGRYTDALNSLNACMGDLPAAFPVALYDLNVTMAASGQGAWGYNPLTNPVSFQTLYPYAWLNTENILGKQLGSNSWNTSSSDILLTPQAAALFTASDQRLKFFSSQPSGGGKYIVAGALRRNSGSFIQCGVKLADIYLLRAECKARLNDLAGAKSDLMILRKSRMSAADANVTISDQNTLIKFIIDERTREFAAQGSRWFDMRRLSVDPLFSGTVYRHNYYSASGNVTTYTLSPERLTMRFPEKVIVQNPGMINNP